ncbi:retrovirus-related pol polyprotein from transposon TNT 1-94 [Tanacetum coccineum]
MNMSQYIKMQMVDDNGGNHVRKNDVQNDGNEVGQNAVHNLGIQNVENMNGLSGVLEIANQYGNGNVVTAPTEGNGNGINSNPIRVNNTAKTRRPHLRSNSNTDRVPSKSKSSCLLNNIEKIEETHRKFPIPTNQKAHNGWWVGVSWFGASPIKIEAPKELSKVSLVNESLKKLKLHLARFDNVVKIRTTPDTHTEEFFANNDLKAQLQDKDNTIFKLKDIIKSMREKSKEENVKYDYGEIETKNVELENSVAKLISENKHLCNEINHVKQDLKAQIQDKVFVITSLKNDLRKVKGKEIVDIAAQIQSANTIVPGMFKLDLEPLAPRLLQNREAHIDYLKYTQEQADILQEIVEQAKAKQPLDKELGFTCKHAQRIQELLIYVRDTCPTAIHLSAKKVAVTPKNKVKKVKFAEPLTSSSNIKQVESSTTLYSNTPVLSPTGLKCSTNNCGSKPIGNKRNDMITRTTSRNMKNKVEAQPRKINKKNRVVKPICDVDVKHSLLNANSEPICATCKKSMFEGVHDICLLDFVENVNSRAKSAKNIKNKIFGNLRVTITSANVVPPKKTTSHSVETQKPTLKVYNMKPKNVKNVDIPSSSSLVMTVRFGNDHIERIMGYGDYQLGNVTISRVYYVEGLGHNLFSVGQFCDANLEVAFRKNTCFIRNLEGVDLISRLRDTNLYTISLDDMLKTSLISKDGLARGIPRLIFQKDHLCSACALGKSKKSSRQPKAKDTNKEKLYLLYMDLCGPMRVASINGKRYILVIVDDYSRFTWVRFLRAKDEALEAIIKCIKNIQVHLNATVRNIRTDNGFEFVNQTLREFYENVGISHQTFVARTS